MTDILTGRATWAQLRAATPARVGLQRSGASLATAPLLDLRLAHAKARDAVVAELDIKALRRALGGPCILVRSQAADRREYLLRPDLGRRLLAADATRLGGLAGAFDLAIVVGDGLSARAAELHAGELLAAMRPGLEGMRIAPLVIATGARVKLGDEVALLLGATMVLMLLGERPGLSSPDSLGAYLTWKPGAETLDAQRNCVSNIRAEGLAYGDAARSLLYLIGEIRRLRSSGVALKDDAEQPEFVGGEMLALDRSGQSRY